MARVTVEDCIQKIPNRFHLILYATRRARDLSNGSELTVPRDNDRNSVVALREIAAETLQIDKLCKSVMRDLIHLPAFKEEDELEEDDDFSAKFAQSFAALLSEDDDEDLEDEDLDDIDEIENDDEVIKNDTEIKEDEDSSLS